MNIKIIEPIGLIIALLRRIVPADATLQGLGLREMRKSTSQIDGKLDIYTAAGHGTTIVPTVPIPS